MNSKLDTLLQLLKIAARNPGATLANFNLTKIKVLLNALKYEDVNQIRGNFNNLVVGENITYYSDFDLDTISQKNAYIEKHGEGIYASFKPKPIKTYSPDKKRIVIIGDLNLPQCKKYRVLQKVEVFMRLGYECNFSHWKDVPRSLRLMQTSTSVIFYRTNSSDVTISYLQEAKRLQIPTIYDIDDPIFDRELYAKNSNLDFLNLNEKNNLLNGTKSYSSFLKSCDYVLSSTPGLEKVMRRHTDKPIYIMRNIMDSDTLNGLRYVSELEQHFDKKKAGKFYISYMSGSRAHEADFSMAFEDLKRIMKENDFVHLYVHGHAKLGEELKSEFGDRVELHPFTDYYGYLLGYQGIDLNIIPLVEDEFNDCKSAIRFLESGLFAIPTMVSKIGDFINLIDQKVNGILIENEKGWYDELNYYIHQKEELKKIGAAAKKYVSENQTITSIQASSYSKDLIEAL